MRNIKVSKIGLISLALAVLVAGVIFWILNNHSEASTVAPNNDLTQAVASNNLVPITSVPILMYHYIRNADPSDTLGANLSVSPENFSRQLEYLTANNYQTISLAQLLDGFSGDYKIEDGKKPIVLTFDDGYDDAYTQAYPILKKHNMTATFYIITGQIGNSERMTVDQIKELDANGMIIGSHTKNHLDISSLSTSQLEIQLSESKSYLEQLLGHPVVDFCYPAGKYNQDNINSLKNDGYLTATATKSGIADTKSNLFELPRIRMQNSTDLTKLLK